MIVDKVLLTLKDGNVYQIEDRVIRQFFKENNVSTEECIAFTHFIYGGGKQLTDINIVGITHEGQPADLVCKYEQIDYFKILYKEATI